ncbi:MULTISPECIES: hypothetical protein [Geobacillus]|uniref:hypothetical protein n=1 Tax=Geobacillus TaxID=129337 RepID=UPI00051853A0|nr:MULTISPECIES: hypothetical protein [Geobacillus]AKU27860.1 hypothetical protein IB49_17365 [Geobacillus sp. LC300]MED4333915.1 hypothetical protein [Geobacillus stearothermophilus]MED4996746.1 hypothetical protein [Geobacillus stearothermophilus]NNU99642.1 hypothetical protein [Geobacillus sp. DSP4a]
MQKLILIPLFMLFLLGACNDVDTIQQSEDEKAKAKAGENAKSTNEDKQQNQKKKEDIWTYYENATWSDNFKGLKTTIQKVVVSDKAPGYDEEGNEIPTSAVGVKFQIENTTEGKFTTYPDQAVLVTSTGEQIDMPDMIVSDHIGGEIDKGVIKEGDVIWYLQRGNAEKIEWIRLKWSAHVGGEDELDGEMKEYEVELKLK